MKKINYIKIILDIAMAIILLLLFNHRVLSGQTFHEVAGLVIGGAFLIHLVLNFKWIKQVTLKIFSSKMNFRIKLGYIINVLLLLCFIIIIISGILSSKAIFPNLRINSSMNFQMIHVAIAYIALILVGIHIGLHWNWVINVFKKVFGITENKKIFAFIGKFIIIILFVFGSYSIYSANYFSRISSISMRFSAGQSQMQGGEKNMGNSTQGGQQNGAEGGEKEMAQHQGGAPAAPSALGIILTYGSILSVFSIITFYLDKVLLKRKINKI